MDVTFYAVAMTDRRLAERVLVQARARRDAALKMFLEVEPTMTIEQMCSQIASRFVIGSSDRLQELHICAHGNLDYGYIDIGTGLRAAQTMAFRAIRRCWVNTGQVAPGAHMEMNVCSAAGYAMLPIMIGLANDAGVTVKACPVPILQENVFNPPEGFRRFCPGEGAVSQADYHDPEAALQRPR